MLEPIINRVFPPRRFRGQLPHDQGEADAEEEETDGEPKYVRKYFWTHYVDSGFPNRVRCRAHELCMYSWTPEIGIAEPL